MAKRSKAENGVPKTADYRHTRQTRTNIPPAKIAAEGKVPKVAKVQYHYSPHLPPVLRFDPTGRTDAVPELISEAGRRPLTTSEQKLLVEALRNTQPWLEWATKREQHERGFYEVDPVALHIHERVSTQAILRVLAREDVQRDLFADPQQPYSQAVQFYKHSVDWANRLILGDSLQVMTSLARREHLSGQVQMIYIDPPYGIRFSSNFQPLIRERGVKDRDQDLTREPEMVRAYRDTWLLGVHSYLAYLRDRLGAARELLSETGSVFVQIGDENLHRVRSVLDEVFGPENSVALIPYVTTSGVPGNFLSRSGDYLLWYAKDISKLKYRQLYRDKEPGDPGAGEYRWLLYPDGSSRPMTTDELAGRVKCPDGTRAFRYGPLSSSGAPSQPTPFFFRGVTYNPGANNHWKTTLDGMARLGRADYLLVRENSLAYYLFLDSYPVVPIANIWQDTKWGFDASEKAYVVQTNVKVVERCILMTTDPGDLVLDPTCGSGTTAYAAEMWGRRWITCDTSRVALSVARQRIMTARFPYYELRSITMEDEQRTPNGTWLTDPTGALPGKTTFKCKTVPHITLKSIARSTALDPIFDKHEPVLARRLNELNRALKQVAPALRQKLAARLIEKQKREGRKGITDADRRRWDLPKKEWREWEVPFDIDPDWPKALQDALTAYRTAWRTKMDEVNACISKNAEMEELVDQPEDVKGVVRVSGPFTVEGVRPEELSLGEDGLFDPTPNEFEYDAPTGPEDKNLQAYFSKMTQHLRSDGVSFMDNTVRRFGRLETLFDSTSGSVLHAEGTWDGTGDDRRVAVTFGPESGPVTALQVEEAIREARQYHELVIAGFSFDAEVAAVVAEQNHPHLRIHQAFIRPDLNSAMNGLLKDTPRSQLFTVFGQPDIEVKEENDGWVCTLSGVSIYDPLENMVRSTGADKVAAWFLDTDFDGRCFCITQAFFPDQNAWKKIANALGTAADVDAFEKLKGTSSLPFSKGNFARIAVKVIDPRGNEVMAIRKLD